MWDIHCVWRSFRWKLNFESVSQIVRVAAVYSLRQSELIFDVHGMRNKSFETANFRSKNWIKVRKPGGFLWKWSITIVWCDHQTQCKCIDAFCFSFKFESHSWTSEIDVPLSLCALYYRYEFLFNHYLKLAFEIEIF